MFIPKPPSVFIFLLPALASHVSAHTAAFTDGMFCRGGNITGVDDQNTNVVVDPLWELTKQDWWMQHDRGCDAVPPPDGGSLELPAGGSFTVELAHNRAFTTLSFDGANTSDWPDGLDHPDDWSGPDGGLGGCLSDNSDGEGGALHTHNQSTTAGTAWAISYQSDISQVTMENLVVFSVLEHTPWKRLATYQVPTDLPACPEGGCYCAWLWIPDGCGQPNMYMQNHKCHVTGSSSSSRTLAAAQPPVYCGDGTTACVTGAKQMMAWNQAEGNNVSPPSGISPGYNALMGYQPGAQNDIFV